MTAKQTAKRQRKSELVIGRDEKVEPVLIDTIDTTGNVREISDENLEELVDSIKSCGILEPLLVAWDGGGSKRRLVFGFRRIRAARLAGLKSVPCIVRKMNDQEIAEARLVENLQREDLDVFDEGRAFKAYLETFGATQKDLAEKVGLSQPYVSNRIRLLDLDEKTKTSITRGIISPSHGEVILKVPADAKDRFGDSLREDLVELAQQHGSNVAAFNREVNWRLQQHNERKKQEELLKKKVDAAKFKTCPKCKSEPRGFSTTGKTVYFYDSSGHYWTAATGKDPYGSSRTYGVEGRTEKKEKRDMREGASIRSGHDAHKIATELLAGTKPSDIRRVVFVNDGYRKRLEIILGDASLKDLKETSFSVLPHDYATGEKTQVQVEAFDNDLRRKMKKAFLAWQKASLPAVKLKKTKVDADTKNLAKKLEGNVEKVANAINAIEDVEVLERLRDLEVKGKQRVGVLSKLDSHINAEHGGADTQ